jgi:hypothetical protein
MKVRRKFDRPYKKISIRRYGEEVTKDGATTSENVRYLIRVDDGYTKTSSNCEEIDILRTLAKTLQLPNSVGQVKRLRLKTYKGQYIE